MRLRDRFRMWFQWFCGTLALEKAQQARHAELMFALGNIHKQIVSEFEGVATGAEDRHGELIERFARLEQYFVTQHVGTRPASMPVLDWEQVQIQELAEMLANPPKEEH